MGGYWGELDFKIIGEFLTSIRYLQSSVSANLKGLSSVANHTGLATLVLDDVTADDTFLDTLHEHATTLEVLVMRRVEIDEACRDMGVAGIFDLLIHVCKHLRVLGLFLLKWASFDVQVMVTNRVPFEDSQRLMTRGSDEDKEALKRLQAHFSQSGRRLFVAYKEKLSENRLYGDRRLLDDTLYMDSDWSYDRQTECWRVLKKRYEF